jgi:hypothetical protein
MNAETRALAQRLVWWKSPEEALTDQTRFLAQLMTFGTWKDWQMGLRYWSEENFRTVLRNAPAGVFDPRSWAYWHRRLGMELIPPLPTRHLPDAA